jgi:hypothetical protein
MYELSKNISSRYFLTRVKKVKKARRKKASRYSRPQPGCHLPNYPLFVPYIVVAPT